MGRQHTLAQTPVHHISNCFRVLTYGEEQNQHYSSLLALPWWFHRNRSSHTDASKPSSELSSTHIVFINVLPPWEQTYDFLLQFTWKLLLGAFSRNRADLGVVSSLGCIWSVALPDLGQCHPSLEQRGFVSCHPTPHSNLRFPWNSLSHRGPFWWLLPVSVRLEYGFPQIKSVHGTCGLESFGKRNFDHKMIFNRQLRVQVEVT